MGEEAKTACFQTQATEKGEHFWLCAIFFSSTNSEKKADRLLVVCMSAPQKVVSWLFYVSLC